MAGKKQHPRESSPRRFRLGRVEVLMPWNPEWRLEKYRSLLMLQVRKMHLDPRLQRRFDLSDLIQDTFLKAYANRDQFKGDTEAELVKWLQEILGHVVIDEIRYNRARIRDVAVEKYLQEVLAQSSTRLEGFLVANQSSPSERGERHEQLLRVAAAIEQLAPDEGDVIIHHYLLGTRVQQIARELGRTEKAAANLLYRAMGKLRKLLAPDMAPNAAGEAISLDNPG